MEKLSHIKDDAAKGKLTVYIQTNQPMISRNIDSPAGKESSPITVMPPLSTVSQSQENVSTSNPAAHMDLPLDKQASSIVITTTPQKDIDLNTRSNVDYELQTEKTHSTDAASSSSSSPGKSKMKPELSPLRLPSPQSRAPSDTPQDGLLESARDRSDDVFANGSEDSADTGGVNNGGSRFLLHPDGASGGELAVMPRKSSLVKDGNRRGANRRKKTVSFSSMPGERTVINAADCLEYMQNGSEMIKVRPNGKKYHRLFTLDMELGEVKWMPTTKKKEKAKISVDQIKEVRVGRNSDTFRIKDIDGSYQDPCFFSIVCGDNFETLDLIASSADECNIWVTGLTCLITGGKHKQAGAVNPDNGLIERQQLRDKWLQEVFESADVDGMGVLDEFEVIQLMKKLNNNLATIKIQQKLKEMSRTREGMVRERLTSAEFISLFKEVSTRPEIYFLLVRYASASDFMTTDELMFFLEAEQGMSQVTTEKCLEIINEFEPSSQCRQLGQLGIDGFTQYLLSEECDIFDSFHLDVCQDMSYPLSHYFIASSHNTYLLKDQLKGPSSTEGYMRALKKGCRYIELDCWDGANDEPIIYHGHTLTSKVSFSSVIETINDYAFTASEYPVILNIENHCSLKQQLVMVECMRSVFRDKLYTESVDSERPYLPSPEFFRKKILVRCKKLHDDDAEAGEGYVTEEDENAETEQHRNKGSNKREGSLKKYKLAKELSDIVQYCRSVRFNDFQTAQQKGKCWEVYSFSESTAMRLANACPEEFVNHNKRFLSRVFPNGMRVDSSNFNPQDLWNYGCQLVALNYQTCGLMMDLNDGRFMQNGSCGYVLKPAVMREEIAYFSANTRDIIPGVSPQILHVKVISGQQLPKPKASGAKGNTVDPYVTVEIFGIPADCVEERTKTVQHSQNPIFDECFEFQVNLPELALVRFAVLDDEFIGDEFIGQYTIPFECMQPGYRHIRLRSNTGEVLQNCSIFVHVAITNRKGGGKATRRGSFLRTKTSRGDTGHYARITMKTLGIKVVDETFKAATQPLRDGVDLWDKVQIALASVKETCSLSPISNIKQAIRAILSRIQNSSDNVTMHVVMKESYPTIEVQGNIADALKKAIAAFHTLMDECRNVIEKADDVCDKLLNIRASGMEFHEDLQNLATQHCLKEKKFNKAVENFAWNVRVLKGQADLMRQAKLKCLEDIKQIQDTAMFMGLMKKPEGTVIRVPSTGSIASNSSLTAALHVPDNSGVDHRSSDLVEIRKSALTDAEKVDTTGDNNSDHS